MDPYLVQEPIEVALTILNQFISVVKDNQDLSILIKITADTEMPVRLYNA